MMKLTLVSKPHEPAEYHSDYKTQRGNKPKVKICKTRNRWYVLTEDPQSMQGFNTLRDAKVHAALIGIEMDEMNMNA